MQATIHNEFLTLTVDTHGAEAVSLKNAAGQEMLWQADPAVWKRHAPILFPWTGKLTGGAFTHKGKTYPGGQHGFARDVEHTLLCAEGDTIRLELRSDNNITDNCLCQELCRPVTGQRLPGKLYQQAGKPAQ